VAKPTRRVLDDVAGCLVSLEACGDPMFSRGARRLLKGRTALGRHPWTEARVSAARCMVALQCLGTSGNGANRRFIFQSYENGLGRFSRGLASSRPPEPSPHAQTRCSLSDCPAGTRSCPLKRAVNAEAPRFCRGSTSSSEARRCEF
jgi:hypothetical protein